MQAETLIEIDALMHIIIAALAATFITIQEAEGHTIVAS